MNRNKGIILAAVVSLASTLLLGGCGSGNKEGASVGAGVLADEATCRVCHSTSIDPVSKTQIVPDFVGATFGSPSIHFQLPNGTPNTEAGCQGCHGGGAGHNGVGPIPFPNPIASNRCNAAECHSGKFPAGFDYTVLASSTCNTCHINTGSTHSITFATPPGTSHTNAELHDNCVNCHDVPQTHPTNVVADNNGGVRAVTQEFSKWSHHVTGVTLNSAHCTACHLEGKVSSDGTKIQVNRVYHMNGPVTHLRNADTDADMQWDPAAPNHSTMDTFCMSCHDANGATSTGSKAVQAYINSKGIQATGKTASATNPFGDTISNRYDKMQRPGVTDVSDQFNTTNNSHHAVKGPRYSGRTRAAGPRQIANPAAFAANSSATLYGKRSTIYDATNAIANAGGAAEAFNQLYVPLENAGGEAAPRTGAQTLGDDSTLHCGDCHTVGQWKPGTAKFFLPTSPTTADGTKVSPAIGAHGSNNEYLLRNSKGTDERHTQDAYVASAGVITLQNPNAAFLVCFNCHAYSRYGSVYNATGTTGPHAGEYDASGRCNGVGNTLPFNGYTTGTATDGTQFASRFEGPRSTYSSTPAFAPGFPLNFANAPGGVQAATYTGEQNPDFGNVFGIQCLNCHNSGLENGYGGIHGSRVNTYIDGMGNQQKMFRFLPGLGNTKYVPGTLGGIAGGTVAGPVTNTRNSTANQVYTYITGGVSTDTNWEQEESQPPVASGFKEYAGAGCYTLGDTNPTAATFDQKGLSQDGGATTPVAFGTWGGCDDHNATQGAGDHGVKKRINRPVTY